MDKSQLITEGVYTTGKLPGSPVDEQSVVFKGNRGWFVLVGCSHSGVEQILLKSKEFGSMVGIIGGLHGFHHFSVVDDLGLICPCHCTKYMEKLRKRYLTTFVEGGVGKIFEI